MKKLFCIYLLAVMSFAGRAQAPACPTVSVSCPDAAEENESFTYSANINGGSNDVSPTFNWSVSAGTISAGQGTSSITVDSKGLGGQTVTATVEVGGFDRSCSTSNSCTASVKEAVKPAAPVKKKKPVRRAKP